jgi:hypothetical protein
LIDTDISTTAALEHQVKLLERKLAETDKDGDRLLAERDHFRRLYDEECGETGAFRQRIHVALGRDPDADFAFPEDEPEAIAALRAERDDLLRSRAAWATAATDAEPITRSVDVVGVTLPREAVEKVREALTRELQLPTDREKCPDDAWLCAECERMEREGHAPGCPIALLSEVV